VNLRHITLKRRLEKIYRDGCLNPADSSRTNSFDSSYVAFELDPTSDVLVKIFPAIKSNLLEAFEEGDQFELIFDGTRLVSDGMKLEILSQNKLQLIDYVELDVMTREEYESIGEFVFFKGKVSLEYLTSDSNDKLNEYLKGLKP